MSSVPVNTLSTSSPKSRRKGFERTTRSIADKNYFTKLKALGMSTVSCRSMLLFIKSLRKNPIAERLFPSQKLIS